MTPVINTPTFSLACLEAVRDIQYHLVAGLSFMVWDTLLTLGEETEYIWQMRRCVFKWFYFYFRYSLLVAQIFHLAIFPTLSSGHMPDFVCLAWYRYVIFAGPLSICVVDIVLATRVYALFNRSRKVAIFISSLILLNMGTSAHHAVKLSKLEYFEACMLPKPRSDLSRAQVIVVMIVQSIIMGMTFFKPFVGVRLGWGRTPLLSFLVKDATSNYLAVFLLFGISMAVIGFDQRAISVFYWSIALFSAVGSRLILNMERFATGYPSDEEIMLTSHITLLP